jgi:glyoxylase-like metal-dependent hydrolase (beta-lactamase superfamily II)
MRQVGKYQVQIIDAGRFRLDGGAMFGIVPRTLWEKKHPPDEFNRILLALNILLLIRDDQIILIDSGVGTKFTEKYQKIYAVDNSGHSLLSSLKAENISPEDVTDVIITHLHFDHAGGTTYTDETGNIKLQFPNATHYIQKRQLEWALKGFAKDKASYLPDNINPHLKSNKLKILNGPEKIFNDIEIIISDGHTVAQQLVLLKGKNEKLLYAADLIPMSSHIPLTWVMAYDLYPVTTIQEKEDILRKAMDEEWFVFFEHDPEVPCGIVGQDDNKFNLKFPVKL